MTDTGSAAGGALESSTASEDQTIAAGENLGTIRDVLIGPDGKAAAAIINVGRFLGIGEKEIAVPFTALRVDRQGEIDLAVAGAGLAGSWRS